MREAVRSLQPGMAEGAFVSHTVHGVLIEPQPRAAGYGTVAEGITYEGDYNPDNGYTKNQIVRKRTGTSQGLYICFVDAPPGQAPVWPEPATGTVYWHLWSFAPVAYSECSDNPAVRTRTVYVQASDQF